MPSGEAALRLQQLLGAVQGVTPGLDYEEVFRRTTKAAMQVCEADFAVLWLRPGQGRPCMRVLLGVPDEGDQASSAECAEIEGTLGEILNTRKGVFLREARADSPVTQAFLKAGGRSLFGVPVQTAEEAVGVLAVAWRRSLDAPSSAQREIVELIAHQIGVANARSLQMQRMQSSELEATRQARLYRTLLQVNQVIVHGESRAAIDQAICAASVESGGFRMACVTRLEEDGKLAPACFAGFVDGYFEECFISADPARPQGRGPAGTAVRQGTVQVVSDYARDPSVDPWRQAALRRGYHSAAAVPLREGGRVCGVLMLYAGEPGFFDHEEERRQLDQIGQDLSYGYDALATRERESQAAAQIAYLAHHDSLTDLPNRAMLGEALQQALQRAARHGRRFTVALIDLDDFKQVNDSLGHAVGDAVLQTIAHRLRKAVRGGDLVARAGGDEFILLAEDTGEQTELTALLQRICGAVREPVENGGRHFDMRCSLGAALYPRDGQDADTLLRRADIAMYVAKAAADLDYCYFAPVMEQRVRERVDLREGLALALQRDELVLHYQPQVNLGLGTVVGFEALLRWQDPEKGLRGPGEFLPAVEGTALMAEVGRWVLDRALAQSEAWQEMGIDVPVAVNIDAAHFLAPGFGEDVRLALAAHPGTRPDRLCIEITETAAISDLEGAQRTARVCRGYGVRLAFDDFGTGASSITLLQELPPDLVKIDQRFIATMLHAAEGPAIIHGILLMGLAVRSRVLAEGIETPAQSEALLRLGCELAQGYAVAGPMSADKVPDWLAGFKPRVTREEFRASEAFRCQALQMAHLRWVTRAVVNAAEPGSTTTPPDPERCCPLGEWLSRYGAAHFDAPGQLDRLTELHMQAHRLAQALTAAHGADDAPAVQAAADALWHQKRDVTAALLALECL